MATPPENTINVTFKGNSGSILSPAYVKDNYLFGIPLKDSEGNELPDPVIETHIRNAAAWLERELQIKIAPFTITDERHDYYVNDYAHYAFINLYNYPVYTVTDFKALYPNNEVVYDFPEDWIHLDAAHGQVRLVPSAGSLSQVILGQTGNFLPLLQITGYLPQLFRLDYVAGFENGEVPDDIFDVIAKRTTIQILNLIGEQIGGLGVSSLSLGLDGISQSTGTTKEGGNVFGGRIRQYTEELKEQLLSLKAYWKGIRFTVV
jgi:hypothetical protein